MDNASGDYTTMKAMQQLQDYITKLKNPGSPGLKPAVNYVSIPVGDDGGLFFSSSVLLDLESFTKTEESPRLLTFTEELTIDTEYKADESISLFAAMTL